MPKTGSQGLQKTATAKESARQAETANASEFSRAANMAMWYGQTTICSSANITITQTATITSAPSQQIHSYGCKSNQLAAEAEDSCRAEATGDLATRMHASAEWHHGCARPSLHTRQRLPWAITSATTYSRPSESSNAGQDSKPTAMSGRSHSQKCNNMDSEAKP